MMSKRVLEGKFKFIASAILAVLLIVVLVITRSTLVTPDPLYPINDNSIITLEHVNSGNTLALEVAATEQKRQSGLMFRDQLNKDEGMFFIFGSERDLSFWMKNTSISLDIIFLDKNLKVTSISSNTKILQTSEIYDSKSPAQFVIETLAGWALQHQVQEGDSFTIVSIK